MTRTMRQEARNLKACEGYFGDKEAPDTLEEVYDWLCKGGVEPSWDPDYGCDPAV